MEINTPLVSNERGEKKESPKLNRFNNLAWVSFKKNTLKYLCENGNFKLSLMICHQA